MPNFGIWEWLIILVIVLVIFGASRLRDIGSGLGGAINAFRNEVKAGREEGEEGEEAQAAGQEKESEA
jgi:sec-independent protein translocase protein TatA